MRPQRNSCHPESPGLPVQQSRRAASELGYFRRHDRYNNINHDLSAQDIFQPFQGGAVSCIGHGDDRDITSLHCRAVFHSFQ